MAVQVELVNGPSLLDVLIAVGTLGAAVAAAYAAWMANIQNKRLTERKLRFRVGYATTAPREGDRLQVRLAVSNDSSRPITVVEVGFRLHPHESDDLARESDAADGTELPMTLQDGGLCQWVFDAGQSLDRLVAALHEEPALVEVYARDAHGVVHSDWCARGRWRRMRESYVHRRQEKRRRDAMLKRLRVEYGEIMERRDAE
jgi:hypothetical protein